MKVILLQDIKGVGHKFDVKQVKDGYARNFLFPRGLAKFAKDTTVKELETQKAAWQKEKQEIKNLLETLAKKLAEQEFRFTVKTGEKGEIFSSVNKEDIKTRIYTDIGSALRNYSDNLEIELERPIKKLGEHQVEINLGEGIKTTVKLIIEPSQL